MAIVVQKLDDCEKQGLQHAWKLFEIRKGGSCGGSISSPPSYSDQGVKIPISEGPEPYIKNETTHVRSCKNCLVEELFEVKETRKWVRK